MVAALYAWDDHPLEVLLAVASLALTLGAAEWLVRTVFPHPPGFPAVESAKLFLPRIDLENPEPARGDFTESHREAIDACAMLYPERHPGYVAERTRRDGEAEGSVVYLGDSMTYGLGVGLEQAFPAVLERRTPTLFHFNLGFPGTSVDYHYVIAKHWVPLVRPPVKLVVIGLYFNDILEIGQGMSCCWNRSVVTFEEGSPVQRCPQPSWVAGYGESISWFLLHSPPPYPLRVAMQFSYLARYAGAVLSASASRAVSSDRPDREDAVWDQMGGLLLALRNDLASRDIPLVAVMLPMRGAFEAPDPQAFDGYGQAKRTEELAKSLGIRTLDPWDHFLPLVKRDGVSRYFLGGDDIHLSPDGHIELANWLAENVPEIRAAVRP
jgi:lysophospholipase L1-like esterase